MPSAICCPSCKRILNLPAEALNSLVQCPACKHQFHPAEAAPAENVRAAPSRFGSSSNRDLPPSPDPISSPGQDTEPIAGPDEQKMPPAPPRGYDAPSSYRRNKRGIQDVCPNCQAFVDAGINTCPECGAEFEPDDDEGYRPWEQAGLERRDSESHRGGMLLTMGIFSLVLPLFFFICFLGIITSLTGLVLGVATIWMSRRDLHKMREHIMAREGEGVTSGARVCAVIGVVLNSLALAAALALVTLL
jgi:hypothetical protein